MSKDRNGPFSRSQTWTLFQWTRKDYRAPIEAAKLTYGQVYDLIGQVITVAKAADTREAGYAAGRAEAEKLLAQYAK